MQPAAAKDISQLDTYRGRAIFISRLECLRSESWQFVSCVETGNKRELPRVRQSERTGNKIQKYEQNIAHSLLSFQTKKWGKPVDNYIHMMIETRKNPKITEKSN